MISINFMLRCCGRFPHLLAGNRIFCITYEQVKEEDKAKEEVNRVVYLTQEGGGGRGVRGWLVP